MKLLNLGKKMNDIKLNIGIDEVEFELNPYNQLYIIDYYTGFKILMKLKEFEGEKFDEYYVNMFKGNVYLHNQKVSKKDLLVIDLNDFSKIINNLTFEKNSLLKKIYIEKILKNINEDEVHEKIIEITNNFKIDKNIKFQYKDPQMEKIIDYFFTMYVSGENEYLKNPNLLVEVIIEYLNSKPGLKIILIIDSSIKAFDFEELIKDERITIIDTSLDLNKKSSNLLLVNKDFVESVDIETLINKIEYNWPGKISYEEVHNLLSVYFRIILNDEVGLLNKPSNNLLTLYYVLRKSLNLSINHKIEKNNEKLTEFLREKML